MKRSYSNENEFRCETVKLSRENSLNCIRKSNAVSVKNKATSLRKREVVLSKISFYIVFVFLFCHSIRIVPNTYEMVTTYTKVRFVKLDLYDLIELNCSSCLTWILCWSSSQYHLDSNFIIPPPPFFICTKLLPSFRVFEIIKGIKL